MAELDCRGLACPGPVLRTKELIETGADQVAVRVDNEAAKVNVTNFLKSQGYEATTAQEGPDFLVNGRRTGQPAPVQERPAARASAEEQRLLVMVAKGCLGEGDDELGRGLMVNFLATLKEMGPALWRLVLLNGGVKLAVAGAETLASLKELEASGVSILVCGTCLNFFKLLEQKAVGETTNMLDIVTSLQLADRVISIT